MFPYRHATNTQAKEGEGREGGNWGTYNCGPLQRCPFGCLWRLPWRHQCRTARPATAARRMTWTARSARRGYEPSWHWVHPRRRPRITTLISPASRTAPYSPYSSSLTHIPAPSYRERNSPSRSTPTPKPGIEIQQIWRGKTSGDENLWNPEPSGLGITPSRSEEGEVIAEEFGVCLFPWPLYLRSWRLQACTILGFKYLLIPWRHVKPYHTQILKPEPLPLLGQHMSTVSGYIPDVS
jgi:hypothetical protein